MVQKSLLRLLYCQIQLRNYSSDVSFLLQYELLFCIEEDIDPAIMVVQSLIEKYPKVDAQVFIGKSFHQIMASGWHGMFSMVMYMK